MRKIETTNTTSLAEMIQRECVCSNHNGKMENMISFSSCTACNSFCQKMAKCEGTVCSKCYAGKMMRMYKSLRNKTEKATEIMTKQLIPFDDLPVFANNASKYGVVRIEAFGELNNTIQAENYLNIIRKNPHINFGWWTKRPNLIARAIKELGMEKCPENVNIIYSNPYLDKLPVIQKYSFISGYFTVWTSEEKAKENNCSINCGKKKCIDCMNCYNQHDGKFFINELIK